MRRSLISLILAALALLTWPAIALAATDPGLGTAGNFAVLAGTTITNTGPSWITGAIGAGAAGIAPGSFPPGTAGPQHSNDAVYTTAETDLTTAFANAVQPVTTDYSNVNLGGLTLGPGVYNQSTAPTLTGTLTLSGSGIYIFLIGSTLVTANSARVLMTGGAQPCDIFWRVVTSATIAPSTAFVGTIMAGAGIQMQTGATLWGRALARTAAVTLDTNRIIQPSGCTTGFTTNYPAPAFVPAPVPNSGNLPLSLGSLGIPLELLKEIPWLLLIGAGGAIGAIALSVSSAKRRRRTT
jgi:Ice-binding-like